MAFHTFAQTRNVRRLPRPAPANVAALPAAHTHEMSPKTPAAAETYLTKAKSQAHDVLHAAIDPDAHLLHPLDARARSAHQDGRIEPPVLGL